MKTILISLFFISQVMIYSMSTPVAHKMQKNKQTDASFPYVPLAALMPLQQSVIDSENTNPFDPLPEEAMMLNVSLVRRRRYQNIKNFLKIFTGYGKCIFG